MLGCSLYSRYVISRNTETIYLSRISRDIREKFLEKKKKQYKDKRKILRKVNKTKKETRIKLKKRERETKNLTIKLCFYYHYFFMLSILEQLLEKKHIGKSLRLLHFIPPSSIKKK